MPIVSAVAESSVVWVLTILTKCTIARRLSLFSLMRMAQLITIIPVVWSMAISPIARAAGRVERERERERERAAGREKIREFYLTIAIGAAILE